jgi:hypothetical protein
MGALGPLIALSLALPGPAEAKGGSPQILQGSYIANVFSNRPPEMTFWSPVMKIFTAYVTGPNVTRKDWNHGHTGRIDWVTWNRKAAVGIGEWWEYSFGVFEPSHVVIRAWRVRGRRYTRMSTTMTNPGIPPLKFTYKLLLSTKRYGGYRIYYWGTSTTVAD